MPRGSGGIELIPKRSVAMDPGIPLGIPVLISFESSVLTEKIESYLYMIEDLKLRDMVVWIIFWGPVKRLNIKLGESTLKEKFF